MEPSPESVKFFEVVGADGVATVPDEASVVDHMVLSGSDAMLVFALLKKASIWAKKSGNKKLSEKLSMLATIRPRVVLKAPAPAVEGA
jgi:hypothetical protein